MTTNHALVVDDSRAIRRILGKILGELGFDVHEAEHGRAALELLDQAERMDVALVDWNMPEMNGIEFVRSVRSDSRWRALPLMMVTSEAEIENVQLALEAGANEYAMKPFDRSVIEQKLSVLGL